MAVILNNKMNYYHCTKCTKTSVFRAGDATLTLPCCDGDKPVLHKLGKHEIIVLPPDIQVQPPVEKPVELPKTQLDVPAGTKVMVKK